MMAKEKASLRDFDVFGDKKEPIKTKAYKLLESQVPAELKGTEAATEFINKGLRKLGKKNAIAQVGSSDDEADEEQKDQVASQKGDFGSAENQEKQKAIAEAMNWTDPKDPSIIEFDKEYDHPGY